MVGQRPPDGHPATAGSGSDSDSRAGKIGSVLASLVPPAVARRAIAVSVETDRHVYRRDEPVEITVEFENRLPVPIAVPIPHRRRWGWSVDGELEATDERVYVRDRPSTFAFRRGERKRATVTWSGRFERTADGHRSVLPARGEYEIRAFVATEPGVYRPSDSTTIRIE